jgi:hypothetical protein
MHAAASPPAVHAPAAYQQVQVGVIRHGNRRGRSRAIQQAPPDGVDTRAASQHRRAWRLRRQVPPTVGGVEQLAVAVAIGLGRCAVGQQQVVVGEFDVVEFDLASAVVPPDGTMVDQELRRDQHAVDEQ